jgi:hypothetical protein
MAVAVGSITVVRNSERSLPMRKIEDEPNMQACGIIQNPFQAVISVVRVEEVD